MENNHTIPLETYESWRTWLMTGVRRTPVDRRRMRGAHSGLKKILLEGLTGNHEVGHLWQDFSGAMVRHAVEDAMRTLPPEEVRAVKLAYFGGYSNREIAREVGSTQWTVQRRIRRALEAISEHIQRGQALGRRAVYGVALFLSGRWLSQSANHVWTVTAVASAAVVITVAQPLSGNAPQSSAPPASHAAPAAAAPAGATVPSSSTAPVQLPVRVAPSSVQLPAVRLPVVLPVKKILHQLGA